MEQVGTRAARSEGAGEERNANNGAAQTAAKARASEERFRTTVDNAPINIAIYSHDFRLLHVNPPLEAMCPRPPAEMIGKHADELWPAGLAEPLMLHGARALATGERQTYELVLEQEGCQRNVKQWTVVP